MFYTCSILYYALINLQSFLTHLLKAELPLPGEVGTNDLASNRTLDTNVYISIILTQCLRHVTIKSIVLFQPKYWLS